MANENIEVARRYHERTKHSEERLCANPHHLDWDNQPVPFKLYRDLEPIPLPRRLEPGTVSALHALSTSIARETEPTEQVPVLQARTRPADARKLFTTFDYVSCGSLRLVLNVFAGISIFRSRFDITSGGALAELPLGSGGLVG